MSVLTVAGQKGGSGKSTLVRNLAIHFALDGYRVGIVDADLIQQHSSEFFADRTREGGREEWRPRNDVPGTDHRSLGPQHLGSPDGFNTCCSPDRPGLHWRSHSVTRADTLDVVICDLQGFASVAMIHAIHYADLVLIPVQPSNDDLKSCHSTARHVLQAGEESARRTIPYRIVISRASTGFRPEVERVIESALESAALPRLRTPVFERTALSGRALVALRPSLKSPKEAPQRTYRRL